MNHNFSFFDQNNRTHEINGTRDLKNITERYTLGHQNFIFRYQKYFFDLKFNNYLDDECEKKYSKRVEFMQQGFIIL